MSEPHASSLPRAFVLPRRPALLAAALLLFAVACYTDSTGPRALMRAALAVIPSWANPKSAGAPVAKARIIARRLDNTIAKDTVINFPTGADSLVVNLDVTLLGSSFAGFEPFSVTFNLIGPLGDTLFTGGPITLTGYAPGKAPLGGAIVTVPLVYSGPGRNAQSVAAVVKDTAVAFGDSITLTAVAKDGTGAALPGTLIAWTSTDTTRLKIKSKFGGTLGGGSQRGVVKAVASTLTGQNDTVNVTIQPVPAVLKQITANGASGIVGSKLLTPFSVLVQAADSGPVRSVPVTWSIVSGGGTLSNLVTYTDSLGLARDTLTLPATAGTVTVRATVGAISGSPVNITATAVAGTPTKLAFLVNPPASVGAGVAIAPSLQVAEQDAAGNLVASATDSIVIALGANPGGSALSGVLRVKAVGGIATFPGLSLNKSSGGYTLVASAPAAGLTNATSTAFAVSAGAPVALAVITDPSTSGALAPIAPPVVIAVVDAAGNTVTSATNAVTLTIAGGTGTAGAVLGGTTTVSAVSGLATFSTITVDKVGSGYKLAAAATGLTGVQTVGFNVGAGAPALVGFSSPPPTTATSLTGFGTTVQILDAASNVVTAAVDTIFLTIQSGPPSAVLGGTTKVAAIAGVATFSGLTLDKAGAYVLTATRIGTPASNSPGINLVPGAAAQLQYSTAPAASGGAGVVLATQPVVRVTDAAGNTVTAAAGTVTATSAGVGSVTAGGTATITSGIATFSSLTVGGLVGVGTLNFSDGARSAPGSAFTLSAGPASVVNALSGNAQTGNPSAILGSPIIAQVTDAFTNPISGVTVTFGVIAGGGSVGTPSGVSNASGQASTSWTLGGGFGGNVVTATAAGIGTPAQFGAFAVPVGTTATWTGVTSTSWTTVSNWSPAVVPTAVSNVFVPTGTTFPPVLAAAQVVNDLTVMAGVPMQLGANTLTVNGNLDGGTLVTATSGSLLMAGSGKTLKGTGLPALTISNATTLAGRVTSSGAVQVTGGTLTLGGNTLSAPAGFTTAGGALLVMTNALDSLVTTTATFGGGNEASFLSAGTVIASGAFTQASGTSTQSYFTSGTHTTVLNGGVAQVVSFASAGASGFTNLVVNNPGGVSFGSSLSVNNNLTLQAGALTGTALIVGGDVVDAGSPALPLLQPQGVVLTKSGTITLPTSMTVSSVSLNSFGTMVAAGPVHFKGTIVTVGTGTFDVGAAADTVDGQFIVSGSGVVRMLSSSSGLVVKGIAQFGGGNSSAAMTAGTLEVQGTAFAISTANSSLAFAPSGTHTTILKGAAAQAVSAGGAPNAFNNLTINTPAGVTFATATPIAGNVSVLAGTVTSSSGTMTIGGDLVDAGGTTTPLWQVNATTFTKNGAINLPARVGGATATIRSGSTLSPNGPVRFLGNLIDSTGTFDVGAFADTVDGTFSTVSSGTLSMQNGLGALVVKGSGAFNGGNEAGLLTAGTLSIAGTFSQSGGNSFASFIASGAHTTVLNGTTVQAVSFATPPTSAFMNLVINNPAGATFGGSNVPVLNNFQVVAGSVTGTSASVGNNFTDAGGLTPLFQVGALTLTGSAGVTMPVRIASGSVTVNTSGSFTPNAPVRFLGNLTVTNGSFSPGTFSDTVDGAFATSSSAALLQMQLPGGSLLIKGAANFAGGNEAGQLSAGTLTVGGNFTQSATSSTNSYAASGTHVTAFNGVAGQGISFASPGPSTFQTLVIKNAGGANFTTNATVAGTAYDSSGLVSGAGATVTIGGGLFDAGAILATPAPLWTVNTTTFNGVFSVSLPPVIASPTVNIQAPGTFTPTASVRFLGNLNVTAGQFNILGTVSDTVVGNFVTSGGGALAMNTVGGALRVKGNAIFGGANTSPVAGTLFLEGSFAQTTTINAYNANPGHLTRFEPSGPVTISFANPTFSYFNNVTFAGAGAVTINSNMLVNGADSVTAAQTSNITSAVADTVFLANSGGTALVDANGRFRPTTTVLSGAGSPVIPSTMFGKVVVTTNARALANNLTINGGLDLLHALNASGKTLRVIGRLSTNGANGKLITTTATDSVDADSVAFQGADQTGSLTNGVLYVRGNFFQGLGVSSKAFVASGTHKTVLAPSAPSFLAFVNGDSLNSQFQNLVYSPSATAPIQVSASIFVNGSLTGTGASGGGITGLATNSQIYVRGALTMNGANSPLGTAAGKFKVIGIGAGTATFGTNGAQSDTVVYFQTPFTAAAFPVNLAFQSLRLANTTAAAQHTPTFGGPVNIAGDFSIVGVNAKFKPGHNVTVSGKFLTDSGGVINQTTAGDSLTVTGAATYRGGASTMTAGALILNGDLTQAAPTVVTSFAPGPQFTTRFNGGTIKKISFATPGVGAAGSHFGALTTSTLVVDTLLTNVVVDSLVIAGNSSILHGLAGATGLTLSTGVIMDTTNFGVIRSGATGTGFSLRYLRKLTDPNGTAPLPSGQFNVDTIIADASVGIVTAHQRLPCIANIKHLVVEGFAKWGGFCTTGAITGNLIIRNSGSFQLDSAGSLPVTGNLSTANSGVLRMVPGSGGPPTLTITGNATFSGGSTSGLLTSGTLNLKSNFTQTAATSLTSYLPSTGHITQFSANSGVQQISFANPDTTFSGTIGSSFARLSFPAGLTNVPTLLSDIAVSDSISALPTTGRTVNASGGVRTLYARGVNIGSTTFNQVRLLINRNNILALGTLGTSTFAGAYGALDPLQINGGILSLPTLTTASLNFIAATTTGCFARVTNLLGLMTVNLTGSLPTGANAAKGAQCSSALVVFTWP